jgi:hypothetical protein
VACTGSTHVAGDFLVRDMLLWLAGGRQAGVCHRVPVRRGVQDGAGFESASGRYDAVSVPRGRLHEGLQASKRCRSAPSLLLNMCGSVLGPDPIVVCGPRRLAALLQSLLLLDICAPGFVMALLCYLNYVLCDGPF